VGAIYRRNNIMTDYEKYSLAIQMVSYLTLTIGLVVAVIQLWQLRKQRTSEHDWNRRSKAFEYSFSDDPEMLQVLTRLDMHMKVSSKKSSEIKLDEIERLSKSEYPEIKNDIHFALARLEYMCTAMKHSVADEKICRDLLENRAVAFFRFFHQYIDDIRDRRGSTKIFRNIEHYAIKWASKNNFEERRPTDK